jgi:hypothetical protein
VTRSEASYVCRGILSVIMLQDFGCGGVAGASVCLQSLKILERRQSHVFGSPLCVFVCACATCTLTGSPYSDIPVEFIMSM